MSSQPARPQIVVPALCVQHQAQLLHEANIGESGPWQVAIIQAQIVMFQGLSIDQEVWLMVGGDVQRFHEVGCPACLRPALYEEVIAAFKSGVPGAPKALGESWLNSAAVVVAPPAES